MEILGLQLASLAILAVSTWTYLTFSRSMDYDALARFGVLVCALALAVSAYRLSDGSPDTVTFLLRWGIRAGVAMACAGQLARAWSR